MWVRGLKPQYRKSGESIAESHPSWVRGLKPRVRLLGVLQIMSHPSWVRGLKHHHLAVLVGHQESHPSWVRGLKPDDADRLMSLAEVAPFMGAWIETNDEIAAASGDRRTLHGCVD